MCNGINQWSDFTSLENSHFRLVKPLLPGPYVFIFRSLGSFEKKFEIKRPAVGLRIPDHPLPLALIDRLGHPIFSCTASRVMTDTGWWDSGFAEENLLECGYELEDIPGIDLILDHGESLPKQLSTVLDMTVEPPALVRQGIGKL
jgi:tRNA A37 threonylcarbamoyladenosine synthetase subunit TsaC/SUA5/YrdC